MLCGRVSWELEAQVVENTRAGVYGLRSGTEKYIWRRKCLFKVRVRPPNRWSVKDVPPASGALYMQGRLKQSMVLCLWDVKQIVGSACGGHKNSSWCVRLVRRLALSGAPFL